MKHRSIILSACAVASMLAAGAPSTADAETVVKVGVINTFSGPDIAQGEMMERGLQAYHQSHQKDLPPGVTIQLIVRDDDDTGPKPDVAKALGIRTDCA